MSDFSYFLNIASLVAPHKWFTPLRYGEEVYTPSCTLQNKCDKIIFATSSIRVPNTSSLTIEASFANAIAIDIISPIANHVKVMMDATESLATPTLHDEPFNYEHDITIMEHNSSTDFRMPWQMPFVENEEHLTATQRLVVMVIGMGESLGSTLPLVLGFYRGWIRGGHEQSATRRQ